MVHRIRSYAPRDAFALAELFHRSVEVLGPRAYGTAQVVAWSATGADARATHARCTDGRTVLVATDVHDRPLGFIDLEGDGHIDMLYCAPEAAGRGLAHALYVDIEECARRAGMTRLHTEASELARSFFERRGFDVLHRRDFAIGDGVPIHNYAKEKRLSPSD